MFCRLVFPCYVNVHLRASVILHGYIFFSKPSQPTTKATGCECLRDIYTRSGARSLSQRNSTVLNNSTQIIQLKILFADQGFYCGTHLRPFICKYVYSEFKEQYICPLTKSKSIMYLRFIDDFYGTE